MFEINLLPWREQQRRRWHRFRLGLALLGLLILAVLFLLYLTSCGHATVTTIAREQPSTATTLQQQLQSIKFIGVLQQGTRVWAVLLSADGTTHDVHIGSQIPGVQAWVAAISATELVINSNHQQPYVLKMENARN